MSDVPANNQDTTKDPPQGGISPAQKAEPQSPAQQSSAHKREHSWLEKFAVAFAALAFGASAWQGWVARDTEKRQFRAYIHPVIDRESVDLNQSPMKWTYILKNFGQTPACHVRTSGRLFVGPLAFAVSKKPEVINHYGTEPSYCLAPQEEHRITLYFSLNHTERALSAAEKDSIKWGAAELLFSHGTIYYDDIFDQPHITDFMTFFGGFETVRDGKMDWTPEGNGVH